VAEAVVIRPKAKVVATRARILVMLRVEPERTPVLRGAVEARVAAAEDAAAGVAVVAALTVEDRRAALTSPNRPSGHALSFGVPL
jgi:hypothetical protein